ncbi:MAG: putative Ig domain-containing protein [Verrucomicrobia bacterium]|nr:putative Ig domain-containing protein [Verrucomicrobiota bacterium]
MKTTSPTHPSRFGQRLASIARVLPAVLALAALAVPTQSFAGSLVYRFTGHNATQSVDMSVTVNDQAAGNDFSSFGTALTNYRSPTGANCYVISGSYTIKDLSSGAVVATSTFNTNPVYTTSEFRVGYGMGGGWPHPVGGSNYRDLGTHFLIAQEFNDYGDISQSVGAFWETNQSWNTGGALPTSFLAPPNEIGVGTMTAGFTNMFTVDTATVGAPQPLPTQTLTILGGNGSFGGIAANVEYFNPSTQAWQPAYLVGAHPWGQVTGTNSWINYKPGNGSDPGAGPTKNQTLWYAYRVRFTVPADAINPRMTFSLKADNFAQVAINGVTTGGTTQFINNANVANVIEGGANSVNADATFSQNVHPGENTITLNIGDWGGLNGFNFRIDLSMQSSQPIEIVPTAQRPVVASNSANLTYGTPFSYQVSATNSPTSYSATGLPAGLSINSASGLISGTPTQASNSPITVNLSATNAGGTGTGTLTLNVAKAAASIQLSGLTHTYDGTVKSATATTTPAGLNVVFNYVGDRTNAGSYDFSALIDNANYTGSANGTLVINKATATINVAGYTGTYDGTAHGATGSATGVGGANLGTSLNLGASYTNAPGGTANWSFAGGTNYNDASGSVAITIAKANATIVVVPYTVEYDGAAHSAAVASITGVAGESGATVGSVALNTTHTAVGTYADSWNFTGGTNYNNTSGTLTDKIQDTTAPVIASLTPSSATLWPPNHQMVAIKVTAVATDLVGVTSLKIIGVTSSEPDNGLGDGDTANDIQITGNLTVSLRAERAGNGPGRTYTITVEAKDAAGNASTRTCTVSVPKSQGNGK